jgi:hypothetical protein
MVSSYALVRVAQRWHLRLAVLIFMLVAWDPIQHTLAVYLP